MRIIRIEIERLRSIRQLAVGVDNTTMFTDSNNADKTAFLVALRIALTRHWIQSGAGFSEYDIPVRRQGRSRVRIDLRSNETEPSEWRDMIAAEIGAVVQLDPIRRNAPNCRPRFLAEIGFPDDNPLTTWGGGDPS